MEASPDCQVSLTDPDARSMASQGKGTGIVGYNVQTAVDTQRHIIVAHEVTNVGRSFGRTIDFAVSYHTASARSCRRFPYAGMFLRICAAVFRSVSVSTLALCRLSASDAESLIVPAARPASGNLWSWGGPIPQSLPGCLGTTWKW